MRTIKVKFDKNLSAYRGRDYYFCEESGRYYTKIDGEWHTTTNNYYLEPDCHVADDVEIVVVEKTKEYHGGDTVYSKKHGKNMVIFMAHRTQEVGGEAKVTHYTLIDMTNVTPDEVEDAHAMVKTIKIWNNRKNCTEYLYRLRPTRFIEDIVYCLKLDDAEAKRASEWLTFIGINHEVIEVEGNH